ncbi:MAG: flagellar filament capping protein FliD [Rhodocyclales bacterium]|nr:flagellar filament capping protein FliD [Rhodocyclales bacterium]
MATSSVASPGIASGLDVNGIITKLMALEQRPLTKLDTKEADYNAKLTAYGSIKGALSGLQTAAKALTATSTFTSKATSVSDTTVLNASAGSAAAAGSYGLSVTQLAKAHTVRSNTNYAATTDTFNTGTLAITIGGGSAVNVTIDGSNNTLTGIRQAINDANAGVTATIINDGSTNRLVLSSNTSGSLGTVGVAVTDSGSGGTYALSGLDSASLVQTQAADNALLSINGIAISRSSNVITDAVEGVTLNLSKGTLAAPGTATVVVANNTAATSAAIETFVTAFNYASSLLKTDSSYDATTKKGAVLSGDGTVRSIQSQLSSLLSASVTGVAGGISYLADIGIARQADGMLAIDSTKLAAALADPSKDVSSLFTQTTSGNEGIAVRFNTMLDASIAFDGLIASRTDGIKASIKDLGTTRDSLNLRLTKIEAQYRAQFTALDVMITSLNKTSQYLTQMIAALPSNSSK